MALGRQHMDGRGRELTELGVVVSWRWRGLAGSATTSWQSALAEDGVPESVRRSRSSRSCSVRIRPMRTAWRTRHGFVIAAVALAFCAVIAGLVAALTALKSGPGVS